jgi:hypothetical protein
MLLQIDMLAKDHTNKKNPLKLTKPISLTITYKNRIGNNNNRAITSSDKN